jgi:hypothetical protein
MLLRDAEDTRARPNNCSLLDGFKTWDPFAFALVACPVEDRIFLRDAE